MQLQKTPWPDSWKDSAEQWLVYLKASGLKDSTVTTRRVKLSGFARWVDKPPYEVTYEDCEAWMGREHLAAETRKGIRATMSSFFAWMLATGRIDVDPSVNLPHVAGSSPHPRPCPEAGIRLALDTLSERDALMVKLGAELALRRSEIAGIRGTDIITDGFGNQSLVVRGKGDKQRLVPLSPRLAARISLAGDGWLFPSRNDHGESHLSPGRVGKIIGPALPDGYSTHSLRHRAATHAYTATRDLLAVSAFLGHASVATTQRYVAMPPEHLRDMVMACAL
ncbi:integrase [Bifidobacterium callitrichidarum]|uniref:Integrase n=1 Tax=Bifidobacterium callitrichidarum TaxID=2052941 RepID=A0A2U2N7H9_9BIFI|nr:tyrosine-type recombinase/integrase [Bifidobacterium callitrichidarum]PWG65043.1 integrase [Bifidobacterium callitrichidarum]